MITLSADQRGNLAMVSAMALFVVNDGLVKLASSAFPASQILALRGVFACLVTFTLVVALRQTAALGAVFRPRVMLRAGLEGLVAFTFISALAKLPLANITAILQASSLLIIAFAAMLGLDKIGWRRWLAVIVGFAGVLLVVRPSTEGFNSFSMLALLSAMLVAVRDLVTRKITAEIPSVVVAFATTTAVMLMGFIIGLAESWQPLHLRETAYLAAAAIAVALGNMAIIIAYRDGDLSIVSGLRYSVLVFALVAGFLVWGDLPDSLAILGSVLIVGSGLYAMRRQALKQREAHQAVQDGVMRKVDP